MTGATGDTGPRGPSNGYYVDRTNALVLPSNTPSVEILTIDVPAGMYLVNGMVTAFSNEAGAARVSCIVPEPAGQATWGTATVNSTIATVPLSAYVVASQPKKIRVICSNMNSAYSYSIASASLSAIAVASIN